MKRDDTDNLRFGALETAENPKQVLSWLEHQFINSCETLETQNHNGLKASYFSSAPNMGMFFESLETQLKLRYGELKTTHESSLNDLTSKIKEAIQELETAHEGINHVEKDIKHLFIGLPTPEHQSIKNFVTLAERDRLESRLNTCEAFLNCLESWDLTVQRLETNFEAIKNWLTSEKENEKRIISLDSSSSASCIVDSSPWESSQEDSIFIACVNPFMSLKSASAIFHGLPLFTSKCTWVDDFEMRFLNLCSSRLTIVIGRLHFAPLQMLIEIYIKLDALASLDTALDVAYRTYSERLLSAIGSQDSLVQNRMPSNKTSESENLKECSLLFYYKSTSVLISKTHQEFLKMSPNYPQLDVDRMFWRLIKICLSSPLKPFTSFLKHLVQDKPLDKEQDKRKLESILMAVQKGFQSLAETIVALNLKLPNNLETDKDLTLLVSKETRPNEERKLWWENFCVINCDILFPKGLVSASARLITEHLTFLCQMSGSYQTIEDFLKDTQTHHLHFTQFWINLLNHEENVDQPPAVLYDICGALVSPTLLDVFDRVMEIYWTRWETLVTDMCERFSASSQEEKKTDCRTTSSFVNPPPEMFSLIKKSHEDVGISDSGSLLYWKRIREFLCHQALPQFLKCLEAMWKACYTLWNDPLELSVASRIFITRNIHRYSHLENFLKLLQNKKFVDFQHLSHPSTYSTMDSLHQLCPLSLRSLTHLISQSKFRLIHSALDAMAPLFHSYTYSTIWCRDEPIYDNPDAHHQQPSNTLIIVIDYLLSILQYFDLTHAQQIDYLDVFGDLKHDLEELVKNVVSLYCHQVLQIPKMNEQGKDQLLVDIQYLKKTCLMLGCEPSELHEIQNHVILKLNPTPVLTVNNIRM